jgi:hypothetical protein
MMGVREVPMKTAGGEEGAAESRVVKLALPGRPFDELPFTPGSIRNVADCLGSVL